MRPEPAADTNRMSPTVLVCDNEPALRALVRASLEPVDCTVVEACDGAESYELAQSMRPDLILLDMMMPGRSGLEVLTELRAQPEFEDTPVLMLTARAQEADRNAAAGAGADRFLMKPFSPRELSRSSGSSCPSADERRGRFARPRPLARSLVRAGAYAFLADGQ